MPRLLVHPPDQVPFSVELRDGARIGRHSEGDVVLTDTKASRRHAVLHSTPAGWMIEDLGSTHGTLVNGARVTEKRQLLRAGDQIEIGEVLLIFSEETGAQVLHRQVTDAAGPRRDAARLQIFYDLASAIGALEDPDVVLGRMLEAILDVLGCERALAGLCEPDGLRRIARARSGAPAGEIVIARSLLDAMLKRRESVIVREPQRDGTLARERITSAMGVPLVAGPRLFGLLYVDDRGAPGRFSEQDLAFLAALGHLTATALESAERFRRAASQDEAGDPMAALIGQSDAMRDLRAQIRKYAASQVSVLVHGESGSGKELVARALHVLSPRRCRPFEPLNCAAIPETMIESELFGHLKGSFTGALKDKRGKFILAHRGTLFLDEIGDLGAEAQAKLLRAIQEGEVQPIGAERAEHVDVRVISATHKDLAAEVRGGRFREDLFYRLAVVELEVPPLRERGDDVAMLARAFLDAAARRQQRSIVGFSAEALVRLRAYAWPGNVRELQNECERAAIVAEGPYVEARDLSHRVRGHVSAGASSQAAPRPDAAGSRPDVASSHGAPSESLAERYARLDLSEMELVREALAATGGNKSKAAELLGVSRIVVRRRIERFSLKRSDR